MTVVHDKVTGTSEVPVTSATKWNRYPAYRDSGIEWLDGVPENWETIRLKHGYDVCLGKMLQSESSSSRDTLEPYLRTANVFWSGIDVSDIKEMWFSPYEKELYDLEAGDLIVCEGGDVGRSAIWNGELPRCYIQNAVHRVRAKGQNSNRFLYYWLYALKHAGYIDLLCSRATIAHFTAEKVKDLPVLRPSLSEQRAIAGFLDRETERIDTLIAKKERLIELLQEKRTALISHAVTKGLNPEVPMQDSGVEWLGEVPAHWDVMRLKYISPKLSVGVVVNPSHYYADEGVPFLFGSDISEGEISLDNARRISEESNRELSKSRLNAGDLAMVRVGDPGVTAVIPLDLDGANCASMMIIRQSLSFISQWLCYAMNSHRGRAQIDIVEYGAAQKQFNISHAVDFIYPVPPREEQASIAVYLDRETARIDVLADKIQATIDKLREHRTALISAAVTGKIDVREEVAA